MGSQPHTAHRDLPRIDHVDARAYRIPTDAPEADGTYAWDSTTLVCVHVRGGGLEGFGYTYASAAAVPLIRTTLADGVVGGDAFSVEAAANAMLSAVRNMGRPGIASTAISAVDVALWDLKAKLLGVSLVDLIGAARDSITAYGSGGFTSYSRERLCHQLCGWAEMGMTAVKMKVGSTPSADVARVAAVRAALGDGVELMVDANGAYSSSEAGAKAHAFGDHGVRWFEEPVSSDDLRGLCWVRQHVPPGVAVAAGEYGYDLTYFRRMLAADAVGVLQADATRCLGVSGFLAAARLCQAFHCPLSAHTAPSLHATLGCVASPTVSLEYFHDHVRIEQMLFDGWLVPRGGKLSPDRSRPGLGVELKRTDAEQFAIDT